MLAAYSMMVSISSLFALFIGMFIIYNSFAIAVTQRRSEIGILRALGATRAQIRWLFLGESAVTGLIGSLGGLVFGTLIARGIAASIGTLISDVYGVAQRADEVAASPVLLLTALGIGIATSIVAAVIPARNAARVDPVQALQKGKFQILSAGEYRLRAVLAAIGAAGAVVCLAVGGSRVVFYTGYVMAIVVGAAAQPVAGGGSRARDAARAQVASARRRRARRRQPAAGAAPHLGERRRAHAVAGARRGVRRHGAGQLQLDHRLDGHGAQPGPVRLAVPEHRGSHDSLSRGRWKASWRRCPAWSACRRCGTRASFSGRRP